MAQKTHLDILVYFILLCKKFQFSSTVKPNLVWIQRVQLYFARVENYQSCEQLGLCTSTSVKEVVLFSQEKHC